MKLFDNALTWVIVIAIVAVLVSSGGTVPSLGDFGKFLSGLINIILAPGSSGGGQKSRF